MIDIFLKKIGVKPEFKLDGEILKLGNKYYLVTKELSETIKKNRERPKSVGMLLGVEDRKKFKPSVAFLQMISKETDKKIVVDKQLEWLFLCGRDIMGQSVIKSSVGKGLALVQDQKDNTLGLANVLGPLEDSDKIYATNLLDLGDFLRREKK